MRRPGRDDVRPTFDVTIAQPLPPGALAFASSPEQTNLWLGVELVVIGLGVVVAVGLLRLRLRRFIVPPAIGGALLGTIIATTSYAALAGTVTNPVPPTQVSVDRGRAVYEDQCAVCHGESGRGDGPGAVALNPRPADFRIHLAAGHTDAQLFDWVSNGYAGSAMPVFKSQLSETDRWNALNYIRSAFGPGVPSAR